MGMFDIFRTNPYEKMFVPGALKVPYNMDLYPVLSTYARVVLPKELLGLDGYFTCVEDQGAKPWCAAYSSTSLAEGILWRKRGYPEEIDPASVYKYAKTIDGDPTGDGTSLQAVLTALCALGHFDSKVCNVKTFSGVRYGCSAETAINNVKLTIHRYGGCLIGCDIDTSWYNCKNGIIKGGGSNLGGHAVAAYGYDEDGILILNSWSKSWGHNGKAYIPNKVFASEFIYGACLTHALDGLE